MQTGPGAMTYRLRSQRQQRHRAYVVEQGRARVRRRQEGFEGRWAEIRRHLAQSPREGLLRPENTP